MKKIKLSLLIVIGMMSVASAQEVKKEVSDTANHNSFCLYINSPLGMVNRIRGEFEYRFNQKNSALLSFSRYYGFTPGIQSYLEYRRYFYKGITTTQFFYGRAGAGQTFVKGGTYALFGAGFGQQIGLGKSEAFTIQFSEGIKVCPVISGDVEADAGSGFRGLFYLTGPGAVLALNINLGWRF